MFKQFIQAQFFNKNETIIELLHELLKRHPLYLEQDLDRHLIFKKIFPRTDYDEAKLRYLLSDLTKVLEEYISFQAYKKWQNYFLLQAYGTRGLNKYFSQTERTIRTKLEKESINDSNCYLRHYVLNEIVSQTVDYTGDKLAFATTESIAKLDLFYVSAKLKYACFMLNNANIYASKNFSEEESHFLIEEINAAVLSGKFQNEPSIIVYFQILLTLTELEEERHYFCLLELLEEYQDHFSEKELKELYIYARNYCVRKMNQHNTDFLRHFNIYKLLLDKKIISYQNELSEQDYKNITTISLKLGEYEFAEQFLHEHKKYLDKSCRKNAFTFNMAHLQFYKKEYGTCLELINKVEFTDPYYHSDSKLLLIMSYYELGELIPLYNTLETFIVYLRRNKVASFTYKNAYLTILKYVKKLVRIRLGHNKLAAPLQKEVSENQDNSYLKWVAEKLKELEKTK